MSLPEVHLVGGTCAEALRLAPVALAIHAQGRLALKLLAGGPDPAGVARTFGAFGLAPHVMLPASAPDSGFADTVRRLDQLWSVRTPSAVLVRGDNLAAALAAHWRRIPVMHLDAGRRSGSLAESGAAEADRRLLAQVATVHLAAGPLAAMNLLDEQVIAGDVLLTGGTAVDAAQVLAARGGPTEPRTHPLVLVGVGAAHDGPVGAAVRELSARYPDVDVAAVAPLPYPERSRLLAAAYLVLTDDDDLAEEALAAGAPVLVPGEECGLVEALHAGSARLVPAEAGALLAEMIGLLGRRLRRDTMVAAGNPYGDGLAAGRVAQATAALLGHGQFPDPMPARPTAGVPL
jgi:UDP-N-acetylglucosamine 2-epimerase (non-hydrolysing)